ncbi:MAG: 5'-methylthioadenosine/adenosylhomocysteine nucleosidase [Bacteroidales bacterium]|nr:5'-methylthioadenosine/adenosylhomocysteine nucleosidase [Bacteroidales bacterium]
MKIGVIIAMDVEYRQMRDLLHGDSGQLGSNQIVLWQCGIGKVNAAIGTMRLMAQHSPDCIVSTGLAGGIDTSTQVMDIMAASQSAYHDVWCGMGCELGQVQGLPTRFDADKELLAAALNTQLPENQRLISGLICTGDQFITDREAQQTIKHNFADALACDMESAAIAHTCHIYNVPFLSLRLISDTPGNTDNHQQQWDQFLAAMCDRSFHFVKQFLEQV